MKLKYQSEPVEYEVIWDGSKTGGNGGYLSHQPELEQPIPPKRPKTHAPFHRDGNIDAAAARGHFSESDE